MTRRSGRICQTNASWPLITPAGYPDSSIATLHDTSADLSDTCHQTWSRAPKRAALHRGHGLRLAPAQMVGRCRLTSVGYWLTGGRDWNFDEYCCAMGPDLLHVDLAEAIEDRDGMIDELSLD